jgi:Flp pilus assembly pilin Flp
MSHPAQFAMNKLNTRWAIRPLFAAVDAPDSDATTRGEQQPGSARRRERDGPPIHYHRLQGGLLHMLNYVRALRAQMARLRDEEGQTLIEYALLAFLVAIVSIVLLAAIGLDLAETFDEVENALGLGATNTPATPGVDDAAAPTGVN